jgi:hypothetical protein
MKNYRAQGDDIRKNIFLTELMDRNETLFHRYAATRLLPGLCYATPYGGRDW